MAALSPATGTTYPIVPEKTRPYERSVQLALQFSRISAAMALIGSAGSLALWLLSNGRYPQLLALVGATGLMAVGAASYVILPSMKRSAVRVSLTLMVMMLAMFLVPAIAPVLLIATVAGMILLSFASQALLSAKWGDVLALVSMLALVVDSVFAQPLSSSLFDRSLSSDFAQSNIGLLVNLAAILGFILIGRQLVLGHEHALAEEQATLRMLIDNLPDYVFIKDTNSRMVINNIAHALILGGSTPEQVIGKTDFDFFPHHLAQKYYDDEQQMIRTGESKVNFEEASIDAQGKPQILLSTKMLLHDARGACIGLVGVCRDITALKDAELERDRLLHVEQEQRAGLEVVVAQLRETARRLNTATTEILAAATQQASSMTEQEAAATQTMTTVEEMLTMVAQTADRAQNVASGALQSVSVSRTGQEAIAHTMEGMSSIKEGVQDISQNVQTLSERTQQIGEIIDLVNTLSDQSKLLALNASIEAARAGDEGRGFTVVAMEVRQLAEQSRQATARVRNILGEIRQATDTAVIASEQGSKEAESGMELVNRAGDAIRELAATIETAAQAAVQIAASTHQQTNGMEQLAASMAHSRQAASQMVASTQQMKQSVQDLMALAQQLEQSADRYSM